jgi:hypothetical protein
MFLGIYLGLVCAALEMDWLMQWSAGKGYFECYADGGWIIRWGLYGRYKALRLDELPGGELN